MTQGFADSIISGMLGWLKGFASWALKLFDLAGNGGLNPLAWLSDNWLKLLILFLIIGVAMDVFIWLLRWRPYWIWFRKKRIVIDDDDFFTGEELFDAGMYDAKIFGRDALKVNMPKKEQPVKPSTVVKRELPRKEEKGRREPGFLQRLAVREENGEPAPERERQQGGLLSHFVVRENEPKREEKVDALADEAQEDMQSVFAPLNLEGEKEKEGAESPREGHPRREPLRREERPRVQERLRHEERATQGEERFDGEEYPRREAPLRRESPRREERLNEEEHLRHEEKSTVRKPGSGAKALKRRPVRVRTQADDRARPMRERGVQRRGPEARSRSSSPDIFEDDFFKIDPNDGNNQTLWEDDVFNVSNLPGARWVKRSAKRQLTPKKREEDAVDDELFNVH